MRRAYPDLPTGWRRVRYHAFGWLALAVIGVATTAERLIYQPLDQRGFFPLADPPRKRRHG
jgi:hypothetical protein